MKKIVIAIIAAVLATAAAELTRRAMRRGNDFDDEMVDLTAQRAQAQPADDLVFEAQPVPLV